MAMKWREVGIDHQGSDLPDGVSGMVRQDGGTYIGYRIRWREQDEDGIERQPSKSFSAQKFGGSLDRALEAATAYLAGAHQAVKLDGAVARPEAAGAMTVEDLFREWIKVRGKEKKSARVTDIRP